MALAIVAGIEIRAYIDYIIYTTLFIICASIYIYVNKKNLINSLENLNKKKSIKHNFIILAVITLTIAADRNLFSQANLTWEESRLNAGMLGSLGYLGFALIYARELMSQRNPFILAASTTLLIICSAITGSRMLVIMMLLFYLQINVIQFSKTKTLIITLLVLPAYLVLRIFRSGDFDLLDSERIDIFSGELEVFEYVDGARNIAENVDVVHSSIVQNLLVWLGPLRKHVCGENVQNILWNFHYDINFKGMELAYRELVAIGGSGTHHPLYFYEYQIGLGAFGAFISIPFAIFLIKIFEIIFKSKSRYANVVDPLLIMAAIFFVRGNSVTGFTQLFIGLVIFSIINNLMKIYKRNI